MKQDTKMTKVKECRVIEVEAPSAVLTTPEEGFSKWLIQVILGDIFEQANCAHLFPDINYNPFQSAFTSE